MLTKIALISALAFLLCLTSAQNPDPIYTYEDFMRQFNRAYQGEQKAQHEAIFNKNYMELLQMIAEGHDLQVNDFMDWNETQRRSLNNFQRNQQETPLSSPALRSSVLFASPITFDYRILGRVTSIKNQGTCGSCWAYASTAQYESLLSIQTNGTSYDLAEQYLIECQPTSFGCNGGYVSKALRIANQTGIPLQTSYPYQPTSDKYYTNLNRPICTDTARVKLTANVTRIQYSTTLTAQQIQQQLVNVGPLTVGVNASHNAFWYAGSSGLINCPATTSIDHAILLVGYNETHWFIKNSWGTNWGHNGYGYINKSSDCSLKTYVNIMQANFTVPPPSPSPTPNNNTVVSNTVVLEVTMRDSGRDGYNGNCFGIYQNNSLIARFGDGFTSGASSGPLNITLYKDTIASIQMLTKGNKTHEVGFTLRFKNLTIIYNLNAGTTLSSTRIFKRFCPGGTCSQSSTITYQLFTSDSWGDGWNGVTLCVRQNRTIGQSFTISSPTGRQQGPISLVLRREIPADIVVCRMGLYTEEIGYIIRDQTGRIVETRTPGQTFSANTVLGSFCPDCINIRSVTTTSGYYEYEQDLLPVEEDKTDNSVQAEQNKGLLVATAILAPLCAALLIALISVVIKMKNLNSSLVIPVESSSKIMFENNSQVQTKVGRASSIVGEDTAIDRIQH